MAGRTRRKPNPLSDLSRSNSTSPAVGRLPTPSGGALSILGVMSLHPQRVEEAVNGPRCFGLVCSDPVRACRQAIYK